MNEELLELGYSKLETEKSYDQYKIDMQESEELRKLVFNKIETNKTYDEFITDLSFEPLEKVSDEMGKSTAAVTKGATTPASTGLASKDGSSESQEKNTAIEDTFGKNWLTDFYGDHVRAYEQGVASSRLVDPSATVMFEGAESSDQAVMNLLNQQKENAGMVMQNDEGVTWDKVYDEEGGGFSGFLAATMEAPTALTSMLVRSMSSQLGSVMNSDYVAAAGTAGVALGATGGAAFGGVGAIPGGLAVGMGATMGMMEASLTFIELLQEEVGTELTPKNVRSVLEDPDKLQNLRLRAGGRGAVIALIETATAGLSKGAAGKVFSKLATPAKTTLTRGLGAATAATAGTVTEMAGGSLGEAGGMLVAGQDFNFKEIALEGVVGSVGAVYTALPTVVSKIQKHADRVAMTNTALKAKFGSAREVFMSNDKVDNVAVEIASKKGNVNAFQEQLDYDVANKKITKQEAEVINKNFLNVREQSKRLKSFNLQFNQGEIVNKLTKMDVLKEEIKTIDDPTLSKGKFAEYESLSEEIGVLVTKDQIDTQIEKIKKLKGNVDGLTVEALSDSNAVRAYIDKEHADNKKLKQKKNDTKQESAEFQQGFIIDKADGSKVIVINRDVAIKEKAVNIAGHEFLHAVLFNTLKADDTFQKNPNKAVALGGSLNDMLQDLDKNQLDESGFTQRIEQYKSPGDNAVAAEEVMTALSDFLASDKLKFKENALTKIGDFIRRKLQDFGVNIKFDTSKDVYNFVRDYNKSIAGTKGLNRAQKKLIKEGAKGKLIDAANAATKNKTSISVDGETVSFSKKDQSLSDSITKSVPEVMTKDEWDSVHSGTVYMDIIDGNKLHGLIRNEVTRRNVPPESISEDFYEDVKAALYEKSMLRFDPTKNDNVGAFLLSELVRFRIGDVVNKYKEKGLFESTVAADNAEFVQEDTTSMVEFDAIIEDTETIQPEYQIKAAERLLTDPDILQEARETIEDEMMNPDSKKFSFKKLPNWAATALAKQITLDPEKPFPAKKIVNLGINLSKGEMREGQVFIVNNAEVLMKILPEGAVLKAASDKLLETSTGLPSNLLNAFYVKNPRISKGQGLKPFKKRRDITKEEFFKYFNLAPSGIPIRDEKGELPDGKSEIGQNIKGMLSVSSRLITNQLVRQIGLKQDYPISENQALDIRGGTAEIMFSKSNVNGPMSTYGDHNLLLDVRFSLRDNYVSELRSTYDLEVEPAKEYVENFFKWVDHKKRPWSDSENEDFKDEVTKLGLYWIIKSSDKEKAAKFKGKPLREEDRYQIPLALSTANANKVDPYAFNSPGELLNKFTAVKKEAKKQLAPDSLPSITKFGKEELGIQLYTVEGSKQGMLDVRKLNDFYYGNSFNGWCITNRLDEDSKDVREANEAAIKKYGKYAVLQYEDNLKTALGFWENTYPGPKMLAFKDNKFLGLQSSQDSRDNEQPGVQEWNSKLNKQSYELEVPSGKKEKASFKDADNNDTSGDLTIIEKIPTYNILDELYVDDDVELASDWNTSKVIFPEEAFISGYEQKIRKGGNLIKRTFDTDKFLKEEVTTKKGIRVKDHTIRKATGYTSPFFRIGRQGELIKMNFATEEAQSLEEFHYKLEAEGNRNQFETIESIKESDNLDKSENENGTPLKVKQTEISRAFSTSKSNLSEVDIEYVESYISADIITRIYINSPNSPTPVEVITSRIEDQEVGDVTHTLVYKQINGKKYLSKMDILVSHLPEHKNAREELIRNLGIEPTIEYYEEIAKNDANGNFKNVKGGFSAYKYYRDVEVPKYTGFNVYKFKAFSRETLKALESEIVPLDDNNVPDMNQEGAVLYSKSLGDSMEKATKNNNKMLPKSKRLKGNFTNDQVLNLMSEVDDDRNVSYSKSYNKIKQAEDLNADYNKLILEPLTGIPATDKISETRAELIGRTKSKVRFFIPPAAEDFVGLLYSTLGKGKVGENQMAWYKEHLLDTFADGANNASTARTTLMHQFKVLKDHLKVVPKDLKKQVPGSIFTKEQALRIHIWRSQGDKIPGVDARDLREVAKFMNSDPTLMTFAVTLKKLQKSQGVDQWQPPTNSWRGGSIETDLLAALNTGVRNKYLKKWQDNVDIIFSKENKNKLESEFGKGYVIALDNMLNRMKTGRNRIATKDRATSKFLNWINGSVGAIMFLNMRSALLQTISAVNFINWSDNNVLAAGRAFADIKQYTADFKTLFNSDFLVERRGGMKMEVTDSEIADLAKEGGMAGAVSKILQAGFYPTKQADSFAIASGGAAFYRNRINSLVAGGMDLKEAEKQAFRDFRETAEESQQSSRPDKISQQQAGPMGRVLLAFANTPAQYARLMKKAILDLKNGRGNPKEHISKIIYYGVAQNLLFNALQAAIFSLAFGDTDGDDEENAKTVRVLNGMVDSILRGTGFVGAGVSIGKNVILKIIEQSEKKRPDYADVAWEAVKLSPPLSSKIQKLRTAGNTVSYNMDEIKEKGFSYDNPALLASGSVVSFATNVPMDRLVKKMDHVMTASTQEIEMWQRVALLAGWDKWSLGLIEKKGDKATFRQTKERVKKRRQDKKIIWK